MSINDLHLSWIISPGRFFVPSSQEPREVETNPELVALENPRERFLREKPAGTFRIFCVGGSTTRGWPFHKKLSYPALLGLYLRDLFPDKKIEVINAGFMASDSTSDLPLVAEILEYGPDLILLYEGRNEEWNFYLHTARRMLRLQDWLMRNVRLYGFFREQRGKRMDFYSGKQAVRDWAMSRANIGGEARLETLNMRMEENLRAMAEKAAEKNCNLGIITQIASFSEFHDSFPINRINLTLKESASRLGLAILDLDGIFRISSSPDLFIDLVPHPDAGGYVLMARSAAIWISSMGVIAPEKDWNWGKIAGPEAYLSELGATPAFLADTYLRLSCMFIKLGGIKDAEKYRAKAARFSKMKYHSGIKNNKITI
jgi:lysophospholipase L1-like esterase